MGSVRKDETGNTYHDLLVMGFSHTHRYKSGVNATFWDCKCKCGAMLKVKAADLRRKDGKNARSCKKCGDKIHGHSPKAGQSPTYVSWHAMISRCTIVNRCPEYFGVPIHQSWFDSFENFLVDMGERPSTKHTIDRIDGTKGYEPGNCRWATKAQQNRNMKTNKWLTFNGQTKILFDWIRDAKTPTATYYARRRRGWSEEDAIFGR